MVKKTKVGEEKNGIETDDMVVIDVDGSNNPNAVTTFGHRSILSTDEGVSGGEKTSNVQGGELESDDSSVDEERDSADFTGTATDRKFKEMQKKSGEDLVYMPVVYLTLALIVVGIVSTVVNPMVFGDKESESFDLKAFLEIVLSSAAGATTFAAVGLVEGHVLFPWWMRANTNAAEAAELSARNSGGMDTPFLTTTMTTNPILSNAEDGDANNQDHIVDWVALRQGKTRPDCANTTYSTTYMIAAGTAFFIALNLIDVAIEMLAAQVANETASKVTADGLTLVANLLLGLSFPEVLKFFDRQLRAGMPNAGLNALQLPENLGLVNGAAFITLGALRVLATELGYGFTDPLTNSLFDAVTGGGVAVAATTYFDNRLGNILSKSANHAVQSMGSGIVRLVTCQDLRSLCPSNNEFHRLSTSDHG